MQSPATNLVFRKINSRHDEDQDIVQSDGNRRRNLVTSTYPGHRDRQQCFYAPKRGEAKKNSNRGPERNRVRCVGDGHERHVMFGEPMLETGERLWQLRPETPVGA